MQILRGYKRYLAFLYVALGSATAACTSLGGAPIGEVFELVTEGGTKPLRENLRPARGSTRVIVFALDGVGAGALQAVLESGSMPRLQVLLGRQGAEEDTYGSAYSIPEVLATLPTSTIASWASVFTGRPPAETGVPGNEWWSRREGRLYAPAPMSFQSNSQSIRVYTDDLLGELIEVPTLFEQADVRSYVTMQHVHRGADLLQLAELAQFGDLFESAAGAALSGGLGNPDVYRETDQTAVASLLSDLEMNGIPDLQVVYFGGVDLITHQAEQPIAEQHRYLAEVVDPLIGRVLEEYEAAGVMDSTFVVVTSDHGHTRVLGDDRHALGMEGEDEPPTVLERTGFRVRAFGFDDDSEDFQAVFAYQGALANIYLADRSTCEEAGISCDWSQPPRLVEDVLPAARAFHDATSNGAYVPELRGTLDLVLARAPAPPGQPSRPFEVFTDGGLIPVEEFLAANARPDLLRLDQRLRQLGEGPFGHRAGDVILLTRWGSNLPIEERFYFGPEGYHSLHGGATAEDSHVPLIVAHRRLSGTELRSLLRPMVPEAPFNLLLTPLVLTLLYRDATSSRAVR